jgi:general secretion pathway protein C
LGTLTLCAFFLAQGTTRVVAAALLAGEPAADRTASRTSVATAQASFERTRDPAVILKRNIFDSERGDLTAEPLPETAEVGELESWDPSEPPPKCSGSLRLVGSVMNYGYPEWSFAAIAGTDDGKTMLYREGSQVDGSRVLAVYPSSVVVGKTGGACQLLMFEEDENGVRARPVAVPQRTTPTRSAIADARKAGLSDEELTDGIEKISDTRFNIQRSLVDKVLANQGSLMRTARVIPHEENGRVVGVKLYGIRRTSLLGRLGIRNGDMLRTINGFDMTSPDSALEAYSSLRSADKLTLAVKRQNNEMTIEYNIE